MAADMLGERTAELYTALDKYVKAGKIKTAVKTADTILADDMGEMLAARVKLVAQIKQGEHKDALATLATCDPQTVASLALEKAYCLYRTNQLQEALEACGSIDDASARLQLEAQVLYRCGEYNQCIVKYQELVELGTLDVMELATNLAAVYVSADRPQELPAALKGLKVSPKQGFEVAYNVACGLVGAGDLAGAHEQLLLAKKLGQEVLYDEELTDAEVAEELLPITVQLGYVTACSGHTAEAMDIFMEALKIDSTDLLSKAVATNNLVASRGARELFDAMKRFDRIMATQQATCSTFVDSLEAKLTSAQKMTILFTRLLVLMHSNKLPACKELATILQERFPTSDVPMMIQAALLLRGNKEKSSSLKADEVLAAYAAAHAGPVASQVQLMRAQIAAAAGNWKRALEALSAVADVQARPAVVATLVALHEAAGEIQGAEGVLDTALSALTASSPALHLTRCAAAAFKEKHGRHAEAAGLYEVLVAAGSSSEEELSLALCGLVRSAAHVDLDKAEVHAQRLPPMAGVEELDATEVETGVGMLGAASRWVKGGEEGEGGAGMRRVGSKRDAADAGGTMAAPKPKKPRKPRAARLPKGFDPAQPGPPPDPERWLPKHERTTFKSKSQKRKMKTDVNVKGSQGAGQVAMELEAKLEDKKSSEVPPPKPQPNKPANKKKGKKK